MMNSFTIRTTTAITCTLTTCVSWTPRAPEGKSLSMSWNTLKEYYRGKHKAEAQLKWHKPFSLALRTLSQSASFLSFSAFSFPSMLGLCCFLGSPLPVPSITWGTRIRKWRVWIWRIWIRFSIRAVWIRWRVSLPLFSSVLWGLLLSASPLVIRTRFWRCNLVRLFLFLWKRSKNHTQALRRTPNILLWSIQLKPILVHYLFPFLPQLHP